MCICIRFTCAPARLAPPNTSTKPRTMSVSYCFIFLAEIELHQVGDALDGVVRGSIAFDGLRIKRVMPLSYENCRDPLAPDVLNRRQNANFIVHQNVMVRRISPRDVFQF